MSAFDPARTPAARRYLVLAATYGDGDAPASAKGFLDRLAAGRPPAAPLAVLGFGDRGFPAFCAYAEAVEAAAKAKGWPTLLPLDTVDRQSPQEFARWGRALGEALGIELELDHQPVRPETAPLTLVSRRDYGQDVQAPTAILRFAVPRLSLWQRLTGKDSRASRRETCSASCRRARPCRASIRWHRAAATASSRSWCASMSAACARAR